VRVEGTISRGQGPRGSGTVASLTKALDAAAKDRHVKAIVLRIDSGGGCALASDAMHAACQAAKLRRGAGKEIPIVASMGDMAASGGYYIAAGCDKIVASPSTITGSIGVIALQVNIRQLMNRIGVSVDRVSRGKNAEWVAGAWLTRDLTEHEKGLMAAAVEEIYDGFLSKVMAGRGLSLVCLQDRHQPWLNTPWNRLPALLCHVAEGRVWSGAQAEQLGLVDRLGGMREAVSVARDLAGLDEDAQVIVSEYPCVQTLGEKLASALGDDKDHSGTGPWVGAFPSDLLGDSGPLLDGVEHPLLRALGQEQAARLLAICQPGECPTTLAIAPLVKIC